MLIMALLSCLLLGSPGSKIKMPSMLQSSGCWVILRRQEHESNEIHFLLVKPVDERTAITYIEQAMAMMKVKRTAFAPTNLGYQNYFEASIAVFPATFYITEMAELAFQSYFYRK